MAPTADPSTGEDGSIAAALDPGFHARALGIATEMVADAALEAAGADAVVDRRLGMGDASTPNLFAQRLLSHLSFRSVWFRNALRGAVGLALAVAVIEVTNVQHGFWVVLGTLSVLRSNALGYRRHRPAGRRGDGPRGSLRGRSSRIGVADHTALLWALLPLAVLVSGIAPSMISFAAGQAAFTVVVIILFNIIEPVGLEGRSDPDRGRGHRLWRQHRGRPPVLAPGRHGRARPRTVQRLRRQLGLSGRCRGPARP